MKGGLVDQSYWDEGYEAYQDIKTLPRNDQTRRWLLRHFKSGSGTCFEIGCFPGRYLTVFGDLGYELNGVDLTPRVETELPRWLGARGYRVGEFTRADFFDYEETKQYDVVCSFGFIEHFEKWQDVLMKQALHVKGGGYLVVQTPNFAGFVQKALHVLLDRENYKVHNVDSMDPRLWRVIVKSIHFEILFCGYYGILDFWYGKQSRNTLQKAILVFLKRLKPMFEKLPKDRMQYSPYCGLIARNPFKDA